MNDWSDHDFECARCLCNSTECDCDDPLVDLGGGMIVSLEELLEDE